MHANSGHDRLDGLRLNACIAWKSCQRKRSGLWTRGAIKRLRSVAIGHVHWARRFKLFRSRQYIPPYLALRIIVVLRVHVKDIGSCRDS